MAKILSNKELIEVYKSETKIIADFYKVRDNIGSHNLTGIINPTKIDNRLLMAPTDNQGQYSACAAYSAATIIESIYWKLTGKLKLLDSHQVYALAKLLDGAINMEGTYLEYAMLSVVRLCKADPEFKFLENVQVKTFFNDKTNDTIELTKLLIHKHDFLQVGFNIDEGWYDCTKMNYVLKARGENLGGHAVNLVGFDSDGFYIQNQWGTSWGSTGFAVMPYNLFLLQFMYGAYLTGITY